MAKIKIGIIVADVDEYAPFMKSIEKGCFEKYSFLGRVGHIFTVDTENGKADVVSVLCGIGKVNATAAAMHLVDNGCNVILNYGLSGGISGVSRGDLCLCTSFLEHDFDLTGIGYKPCEKPSQEYIYNSDEKLNAICEAVIPFVKKGMAVTGDRFICDEEQRLFFKNEFLAMSCDMETAAIAYVCSFSGTPFASLRRISDDAGSDAVDSYREMNTSNETLLSDYIFDIIKVIINKAYEK